MEINAITGKIVESAYEIHNELGPGLFESVYETVLADLLMSKGLAVQKQFPIAINVFGKTYEEGFRADLVVEGRVIVEIKSV